MRRSHYTNNSDKAMYVAGVLIPPGETRLVDTLQILTPEALAAPNTPAEQSPPASVLDILDGSVKDVADALQGVSDDDLETLDQAEQNGKTRKGVLEAIAAERLRRAQANEQPSGA